MRKIFAAAGVCAALFATPVIAQDGDGRFGGFYAGPVLGADDLETSGTQGDGFGIVYGGMVGYDVGTPGSLIGFEGEFTDNSSKDQATGLLAVGDRIAVASGRDLYGGLRVGFYPGANTLIYAKAGYTNLAMKAAYTNAAGATISTKDTLDGFRVGVGAEFALADNMSVRAEYRYSGYGSIDGLGAGVLSPDINRQQGTVGLAFRF